MKIELAIKLKEQRKTKRLTIAEILSRSKVENNSNPTNFRNQIPDAPSNDNPNEPNDQPINLNIQPMQNNNFEVDSLSSNNDWGTSSSSDQHIEESKSNSTPMTGFLNERTNLNRLGARYTNVSFSTRVFSPEAQEMLQADRGFNISDSEELFHQLYNPFFSDW